MLATRLGLDYSTTVERAARRPTASSRYLARQVPQSAGRPGAGRAGRGRRLAGVFAERDPLRVYPGRRRRGQPGRLRRAGRDGLAGPRAASSTTAVAATTARPRYEVGRDGDQIPLEPDQRGAARAGRRTCSSPSTATCSGTPSAGWRRRSSRPAASPVSRSRWTSTPARCWPWPTTRPSTPTDPAAAPRSRPRQPGGSRTSTSPAASRRC